MVSSVNRQIDDAISQFMAMGPEELAGHKPATNAEAMAKKLVTTAVSSEDEALAVRTIQLIADRTEGRATSGSRKESGAHDLLRELAEELKAAGNG